MLVRFYDSRTGLRKIKNNSEIAKENVQYDEFLYFLVEFCFANIFAGCNFNRLNTVLNILLVCFETIKDMSFKPEHTNYYWTKLLIALDSSYEENKELAVVLSKKLDFSSLDAAVSRIVKTKLYRVATLNLIATAEFLFIDTRKCDGTF